MFLLTDDNLYLRVRNSPIHGKGLFTAGAIKQGTILGKVRGIRTIRDDAYVLWVSESIGVRMLCKYKYINHSETPNVVLYDTLEVCALRDIQAGEEITHDYACSDWA